MAGGRICMLIYVPTEQVAIPGRRRGGQEVRRFRRPRRAPHVEAVWSGDGRGGHVFVILRTSRVPILLG